MNYYVADATGNRQGPWPEQEIIAKIQAGQLPFSSLVWTEGMAEWQPASSVFPQLTPAAPALNPYQASRPAQGGIPLQAKPDNYLVWSILATIFCCLPFGIVAIVKSCKVDTLWAAGQFDEARAVAAQARKWCLVSLIVGIVAIALWVGLQLFVFSMAEKQQQHQVDKILQQQRFELAPPDQN